VTTSEELLSFTNTYTYDPAGRLTGATTTDPAAAAFGNATYGYDPAGNRTTVAVARLAALTATYDAADQLIADSTHTYSYDPAGNMLTRTPITSEDPLE
jgi:YD repeat-containing protein